MALGRKRRTVRLVNMTESSAKMPTTIEAISTPAGLAGYQAVAFPTAVADALAGRMAEMHISQQDLAGRLGLSPGRVSQILSGDQNLTLRTLASVASALDVLVSVQLSSPEDAGLDRQRTRPGPAFAR